MKSQTVREFFAQFFDDNTCLEHIMKVRFGLQSDCPKCGKASRFSRVSSQRAYACQWCGHHLYPCVGTPFESSRTSLQLWFYAIYLFTQTRSGVSAKELQRQLGVTYKAAWRMGHEIRKHMAAIDGDEPLSGIVEVDETYVGGKSEGKRGRGAAGKTIVVGMLERDGDIMTQVIPNVRRVTLHPIIEKNVEKGSEVHTDELLSYRGLDKNGYTHKRVNHGSGEYARGNVHVNGVESFWSRLKQSIRGTHVHVSSKHLSSYAGEFEYRYNSRKQPEQMLPELLSTYPASRK